MSSPEDFNSRIIEEFRTNHGKVGGMFEGAPLLLLHHRGARTGTERVNPLAYQRVGSSFAVFGSKGGSVHDPHWYLNLKGHPDVQVEVGDDTIDVTAREATGRERDEIFDRQKELAPTFAEYEEKAKGSRQIPVILLEPRPHP